MYEVLENILTQVTQYSIMILEVVGSVSKLAAFLNLLSGYEILELARTGVTGLSRGIEDVKMF